MWRKSGRGQCLRKQRYLRGSLGQSPREETSPRLASCGPAPSRSSHRSRGWGWGRGMKMILGVSGCSLPRYSPCPSSRPLPCQHNGTVPSTEPLRGRGGGMMKTFSLGSFRQHLHTQVGGPAGGEHHGHPACVRGPHQATLCRGTSWEPATCPTEGPGAHNFVELPDLTASPSPKSHRAPHPGNRHVSETQRIKTSRDRSKKLPTHTPDQRRGGGGKGHAPPSGPAECQRQEDREVGSGLEGAPWNSACKEGEKTPHGLGLGPASPLGVPKEPSTPRGLSCPLSACASPRVTVCTPVDNLLTQGGEPKEKGVLGRPYHGTWKATSPSPCRGP